MARRARPPSRPKRWAEAVTKAQAALVALDAAFGDLESALSDLGEVKQEYEDWKDGMPENLQSSPLGEKLEAICDLDIPDDPREQSYSDLDTLVGEAEGMDLPLGFGRD